MTFLKSRVTSHMQQLPHFSALQGRAAEQSSSNMKTNCFWDTAEETWLMLRSTLYVDTALWMWSLCVGSRKSRKPTKREFCSVTSSTWTNRTATSEVMDRMRACLMGQGANTCSPSLAEQQFTVWPFDPGCNSLSQLPVSKFLLTPTISKTL